MNGFYWIYLIAYGLLLCYELVKTDQQKTKVYYIACGMLILCYAAQDISVSVDAKEYMVQYALVPTLSFRELLGHKFELGYNVMCIILSKLFSGERILIVAVGLVSLLPFFSWFRRESEMPMAAFMAFLALGIYANGMIFYRQMCAMAIMTFAYRHVWERNLRKFILLLLLAATFHRSVVVLAAVYVIYLVPVNRWTLLLSGVCSLILGWIAKPMLLFFYENIHDYGDIFLKAIGGSNMLVILWVFVLLSYIFLGERLKEPKIRLWFSMVWIAAVIQPVVFTFFVWSRVVLFFRLAMVMLIPELYMTLFRQKGENRVLMVLNRFAPSLYRSVVKCLEQRWFGIAVQMAMFAVLFGWYVTEVRGMVYTLAPI